jgi:YHS domain-containing protein
MVKRVGIVFAAAIIAAAFVFAHGSGKKSDDTHGCMAACAEHHSAAMKAGDELGRHLAEAKGSATLAEMRTHVEMAEASMNEMKKHMSTCMESCGRHSDKKALGKVVDPVCGMEIDTTAAVTATHQGKTYYFCTEDNRAKFLKDPDRYTAKRS